MIGARCRKSKMRSLVKTRASGNGEHIAFDCFFDYVFFLCTRYMFTKIIVNETCMYVCVYFMRQINS